MGSKEKLWGGRFEKNTEQEMDDFNSSIHFDARLYRQDIQGSIAHATMLGKQGIIPSDEALRIVDGLNGILQDIEAGSVSFSVAAEDIHMNIEQLLIERIGEAGKRLHTGRSRNDQVALDMRMYAMHAAKQTVTQLCNLLRTLLDIAQNNLYAYMPGYTHLQKAQPITLAHHTMAYFEMFYRDAQRFCGCLARMDAMPLGAGALAGTTYPLDRGYVAEQLGFSNITQNSLDAVSDRDFCIEFAAHASICMMHLSRYCEELILWSSDEFRFVQMDDGYSTGSSIMPQKKNPDVAELVRGKTARVYGSLITLLAMMKALPLAYNKDMQEDKEAFFDVYDTLSMCLPIFTNMLRTLCFKTDNMEQAALGGFTNATDLADYLVVKGLPFRSAHEVSGKMVLFCIQNNLTLLDLTLDQMRSFCGLFEEDIYDALALKTCVEKRNVVGGPAPDAVMASIIEGRQRLEKLSENQ